MADLLQAFRHLPPSQRQRFLRLLPAELTPYEWRALHAVTSNRLFQLDIIGRLPLELVAQIFAYLDPTAPYRCQSVSKQWHRVLQALPILKAGIASWHQGTVDLQHASYASCEQTARNIHSFRTGTPASAYRISLSSHTTWTPRLVGDHLIWIPKAPYPSPSRSACILDLHSWQLRTLSGEAREQISNVVASDQIVMLTTFANTCYVYELHCTREPKHFKVPSAKYLQNVACRGRTATCIACFDMRTSIFVWDYDTQHGTSFDITHDSELPFGELRKVQHVAPLIQPETQTIILLFAIDISTLQTPNRTRFALARYTFRGECIGLIRPILQDVPQLSTMCTLSFWPGVTAFVPVDDSDTIFAVRLRVMDRCSNSIPTRTGTLLLGFDEKTQNLRIWEGSMIRGHDSRVLENCSLTWWKDTCYGFDVGAADIITYMGTEDMAACAPIISEPRLGVMADHLSDAPLLLNEKYLVRAMPKNIYVLCFHENSNRPKDGDSFLEAEELKLSRSSGNRL